MTFVSVVGARPQFIKSAPVSSAIARAGGMDEFVVHTGQHFDVTMSGLFFDQLNLIPPSAQLDIHGGTHGSMTGRMLQALEEVMLNVRPDAVLVYGDTNSTIADALAASKLHIPVAHVEAGLRSFDRRMPEEVNRIVTDHISDFLYCPTRSAVENLKSEGRTHPRAHVELVGDVMLDASLLFRNAAMPPRQSKIPEQFILATAHRAENTDNPAALTQIVSALTTIHQQVLPVVMPVHPRTAKALHATGLDLGVIRLNPVGYLEMLWLLEHASAVVTDSGGLQKEAYFFEKPCITMRMSTEWTELVEEGVNVLVGVDAEQIVAETKRSITIRVTPSGSPYGDGQAANRIAHSMQGAFGSA